MLKSRRIAQRLLAIAADGGVLSPLLAAERVPEAVSVLDGHEVVEERVGGGGEVVEAAGQVVEPLVHHVVVLTAASVEVVEALGVVGSPAQEESHYHRSW